MRYLAHLGSMSALTGNFWTCSHTSSSSLRRTMSLISCDESDWDKSQFNDQRFLHLLLLRDAALSQIQAARVVHLHLVSSTPCPRHKVEFLLSSYIITSRCGHYVVCNLSHHSYNFFSVFEAALESRNFQSSILLPPNKNKTTIFFSQIAKLYLLSTQKSSSALCPRPHPSLSLSSRDSLLRKRLS